MRSERVAVFVLHIIGAFLLITEKIIKKKCINTAQNEIFLKSLLYR